MSTMNDTMNVTVVDLAKRFGKIFGAMILVYLLGYCQFSLAWIVIAVVAYLFRERARKERDFKIKIAKAAAVNEKASIKARVEDLPSWVFFPDTERAEWINKILHQLWPHVGHYVKTFIEENIESSVQETMKSTTKFGTFKFVKIDLGDMPPRIGGVKVYREHVSRHEIIMDIEIFYAGDCDFQVLLSKMKAGIKELQIHGTLRVIFKPLINTMPLIGGLQVFFLNTPTIDFNLTNLADVLDMPGFGDMLRKIVGDQIAAIMVLPNKLSIKLADEVEAKALKFTEPAGVLRIRVIEGKDLMKKDVGVLGMGKSDPYAIISVGAQEFKTKIINNTVNPCWDFYCEATVDQYRGQYFHMVLYDKDKAYWDDFLGRCSIDIQTVAAKGETDTWIPLEEATTGQVHVKLTWLSLSNNILDLHKQMKDIELMKEIGLSTALLLVYVDSARNLPNASKAPVEPCPYVKLTVGSQKKETCPQKNTNDPVWEQGFNFLVSDPEVQELFIEVLDSRSQKPLGSLVFNVNRLLHMDDLQATQPFHLKSTMACQAKLMLSLQLKILKVGTTVPLDIRSESSCSDVSAISDNKSEPCSNKTSPVRQRKFSAGETTPVEEPCKTVTTQQTETSPETINESPATIRHRACVSDPGPSKYGLGRIQLTLRYSQQRNRLMVVIHKVMDLVLPENGEPPDPYVKMYLQPDRNRDSKRKTQIIKDTCNPVFDETFEYMISQNDLNSFCILVTVNNRSYSMFAKSTVMGQVLIALSQLDLTKATTNWYNLEPEETEG